MPRMLVVVVSTMVAELTLAYVGGGLWLPKQRSRLVLAADRTPLTDALALFSKGELSREELEVAVRAEEANAAAALKAERQAKEAALAAAKQRLATGAGSFFGVAGMVAGGALESSAALGEAAWLVPAATGAALAVAGYATANRDDLVGQGIRQTAGIVGATAIDAATDVVETRVNETVDAITSIPDNAKRAVVQSVEAAVDEVKAAPGRAADASKRAALEAVEEVKATPGRIADASKRAALEAVEEVKATPGRFVTAAKNKAVDTVDEAKRRAVATRDAVVAAPGNFVNSAKTSVVSRVKSVVPAQPTPALEPLSQDDETPAASAPTPVVEATTTPAAKPTVVQEPPPASGAFSLFGSASKKATPTVKSVAPAPAAPSKVDATKLSRLASAAATNVKPTPPSAPPRLSIFGATPAPKLKATAPKPKVMAPRPKVMAQKPKVMTPTSASTPKPTPQKGDAPKSSFFGRARVQTSTPKVKAEAPKATLRPTPLPSKLPAPKPPATKANARGTMRLSPFGGGGNPTIKAVNKEPSVKTASKPPSKPRFAFFGGGSSSSKPRPEIKAAAPKRASPGPSLFKRQSSQPAKPAIAPKRAPPPKQATAPKPAPVKPAPAKVEIKFAEPKKEPPKRKPIVQPKIKPPPATPSAEEVRAKVKAIRIRRSNKG